jgi:hypothetical protein
MQQLLERGILLEAIRLAEKITALPMRHIASIELKGLP